MHNALHTVIFNSKANCDAGRIIIPILPVRKLKIEISVTVRSSGYLPMELGFKLCRWRPALEHSGSLPIKLASYIDH